MPYDILMGEAGFVDLELVDVTPQYIETTRAWKRAWEAESEALSRLMGEEDYARRMRNRALDITNAEDGLLRRHRVYGRRP